MKKEDMVLVLLAVVIALAVLQSIQISGMFAGATQLDALQQPGFADIMPGVQQGIGGC